jgi:deoxyadenosine/deoxycytidine kinase
LVSTPKLIIIRGNSASGKSTVARALRLRYGRGCALVEQDYLRRVLLREHDSVPHPIAAGLIVLAARFALDHGYHAIVEGILDRQRYGPMLGDLIAWHTGPASVFYLAASFEETLRRHATRPQATEFSGARMREWFREHDVLGLPGEVVVPQESTLVDTLELIMARA